MCVLIKFEMKIISFSLCVFFKHKWNDDEVEQSIITWITHKHVSMPFFEKWVVSSQTCFCFSQVVSIHSTNKHHSFHLEHNQGLVFSHRIPLHSSHNQSHPQHPGISSTV